ncbi:MAG: ATP-binding protein [Campylobacterota bacterium]|nr:ATP-binding protein [Campylobacterota bacterium]
MKESIIFKVLLILSFVIILIFTASSLLFNQSDNKLINDIRVYNLNKAMDALDSRLEERLNLNKVQMQDSLSMIAKNSAGFLLNFDHEGLKESLIFDLNKDGVMAVDIWDSAVNETFLIALKKDGKVVFQDTMPKEFKKYIQLKKDVVFSSGDSVEKIGKIKLYYDESLIREQIDKLKNETKKTIENFDKEIDLQKEKSNMKKLLIVLGSLVSILVLVFVLLIKFVNKPLKKLHTGLDDFFMFLQNKKDHTNKIDIKSKDEFGAMAHSLNENISVSAKLHEEIYELNTNLEHKIEQKTKKVTTLLNNADQGFLSFGSDLIIDSEFSKECINIFKKDISGKNIADILFSNSEKKSFFIETLKSLLTETNKLKVKTIISLLQSEFIINKKAINVQYKIVDNNQYMLILTDITAKKILEKKINREKNILKMIVAVVSDTDEFLELYDEFLELINSKENLVDIDKTPLHNATEVYRIIHTFKGLFSQKEMQYLVNNLHKLESSLSEAITNQNNSNENLIALIKNSDFESWLAKDIDIIKDVLGDEIFTQRGKLTVKEETISQIEDKIVKIAKRHDELEEYETVVNDIKSLKNKTVYSLFSSYTKLVDQLSQKIGKAIYPLEIIVDKELKVNDNIKPFIKSLVHVFRNSVDHGIESMDERAEIEKDEIGTITCTIKQENNNLYIVVADDGAGLDIEKIKQKAVQLGIDVDKLTNKELEQLIFEDRFTTKDEITQTSGRGVGMSAVKHELDELNGVININSQQYKGTTIEFVVPV